MDRGVGAAVRPLSDCDRKVLAIQALAGSETVSDLAARHGMSRKFVYQQTHKARAALDDAFSPATELATALDALLDAGELPDLASLSERFTPRPQAPPDIAVPLPDIASY